jgi:acetylornithine deacetylase/succinyl-diaminopimelate desuccinylase-like protein
MARLVMSVLLILSIAYPAQAPKSNAQEPRDAAHTASEIRAWRGDNEIQVMDELRALLSIPNFASDTPNIQRNATKLVEMLHARGFETQLLPIEGRGPVVFGKLAVPGASRTVIFYMHYDGQSVDPATWTGTKPYEPALRDAPIEAGGKIIPFPAKAEDYKDDWRLYARSSGDDKSPIVALLAAIDALKAKQIHLGVNVKVVFDGEEEGGSPHLEQTLMAHRELLSGDLLINGDGPVHQSGRMQLLFGNRGIVSAQITVYGPLHSLHSGHYGNWAPNPAMRLAQLLASMKDENGRVLIKNFYDGVAPLGPTAQKALQELPANEADLERDLAIPHPDGSGKKLVELLTEPSLNIDGLRSGDVGAATRTIIPDSATAAVDMRLVKNIAPKTQFDRLVAHIRAQGYFVTSEEPTVEERRAHDKIARVTSNEGYPASLTSMDLPVSKALVGVVNRAACFDEYFVGSTLVGGDGKAVKAGWTLMSDKCGDKLLITMPLVGGSSPMYIFENLGLPVINVPIVNYDDNQHSPNENLRIGYFWRGIEIYGAILADLKW